MKQVIKTYGTTLLTMVIMTVILGCFALVLYGNGTTTGGLQALAKESLLEEGNLPQSGEAFSRYRQDKNPVIFFQEDYEMYTGGYVPVSNCFSAVSHTGDPLLVEVTYVRNIHEESVPMYERNGKQCFRFDMRGVYQVYVQAKDADGNVSKAMVKIPVNKRER